MRLSFLLVIRRTDRATEDMGDLGDWSGVVMVREVTVQWRPGRNLTRGRCVSRPLPSLPLFAEKWHRGMTLGWG
jgi:hypothetical protein